MIDQVGVLSRAPTATSEPENVLSHRGTVPAPPETIC